MNSAKPFPATELPTDLSPYVYGTTRLGDDSIGFDKRVDFAALGSSELQPLPDDVQRDIFKLQYRWSDETDTAAEPWSM